VQRCTPMAANLAARTPLRLLKHLATIRGTSLTLPRAANSLDASVHMSSNTVALLHAGMRSQTLTVVSKVRALLGSSPNGTLPGHQLRGAVCVGMM